MKLLRYCTLVCHLLRVLTKICMPPRKRSTRCTTRADTSFHPLFHAPLRSASGGARSLKPMVGRGPRDQSSGQKPRARLPEALPRPAPVRFERARRREVGRGWIAAFTTESPSEPIFRGGSGGVWPSAATRESMSLYSKKRPDVTFWILPP
jgi:hypothetical protein